MIQIKDISMVFYRRQAPKENRFLEVIRDLSFDVKDNEFVSVVGPSGCGKTTLLLILAGLRAPTTGQVNINGVEVNSGEGKRNSSSGLNIGVVFQEYNKALLPWRDVLSNVTLGMELKGWPKAKRAETAKRYLELIGLAGFEHAYPWELSGGMKQRVQIAKVLAYNPDVMLMDEPFGSLDAQTKVIMQNEFLKVWERDRKTVIFVTHDVIEAVYLADRVITLTARPSTIKETIDVDFPRPREEKLKDTEKFIDLKNGVWRSIMSYV